MTAWTKYGNVDPAFFASRGENSWVVDAESGSISSRFGFGEIRVQLKADGTPDFDRLVYGESPNVNVPAFGRDKDGAIRVLVVFQERPFADLPSGEPADPPIVFAQPCVMAFNADRAESIIATVIRELLEEGGVTPESLIGEPIEMGIHNPNPTFCATWSNLYEVEVDLTKVTIPTDTEERITGTAWLPVREILSRIGAGVHDGINYRSATANDAFFVWLARHPEALA